MGSRKKDQTLLVWWAALGLGLGLLVLSLLIWVTRHPDGDRAAHLAKDIRSLEPMLIELRQGKAPTPEMVAQSETTTLAPLMHALLDAQRQREQALAAYQAQIESVALGDWLTPANLVSGAGRATVRLRLAQLQGALDSLIRRDGAVQSRLDEATAGWLKQTPSWGDEAWRRQLLSASAPTAETMTSFFRVEHDIVARVEDLLDHLDKVGNQVTLENGAQQELVFSTEADLSRYRATLVALGDLGRSEQQWLSSAQKAGGQHARRVADLLLASVADTH
jgi:hypothetical protein